MHNFARNAPSVENKDEVQSLTSKGTTRPAGSAAPSSTAVGAHAPRSLPVLTKKSSIDGIRWLSFVLVAGAIACVAYADYLEHFPELPVHLTASRGRDLAAPAHHFHPDISVRVPP